MTLVVMTRMALMVRWPDEQSHAYSKLGPLAPVG